MAKPQDLGFYNGFGCLFNVVSVVLCSSFLLVTHEFCIINMGLTQGLRFQAYFYFQSLVDAQKRLIGVAN